PPSAVGRAHRLERVVGEVQYHLLELLRVGGGKRYVGGEIGQDLDVPDPCLIGQQVQGRVDDFVDRHDSLLRRAPPHGREEVPYDPCGSVRRVDDLRDTGLDLRILGAAAEQLS